MSNKYEIVSVTARERRWVRWLALTFCYGLPLTLILGVMFYPGIWSIIPKGFSGEAGILAALLFYVGDTIHRIDDMFVTEHYEFSYSKAEGE